MVCLHGSLVRKRRLNHLRTHRIAGALTVAVVLAVSFAQLKAAGTWVTETSLPGPIQETSSVTELNGKVYIVGGSLNGVRTNQNLSFDPTTHAWTARAPYPGTALDHMNAASTGGYMYLVGGLSAWPQPSVTTVQRYDPVTNTWTAVAPLPVGRAAAGVAVINGRIYVAGGLVNGVSVADFTVYDPSTNAWTTLPSMPTARDHLVGAALNGKFYAIGGRDESNSCAPFKTVEVFDPSTNTWTAGTPTLNAHAGHSVGQANGHIQVFGGDGNPVNCGLTAASEDYNPVSNSWTAIPPMPTPRHGTGGATIGNSVYIPGGGTGISGDAPSAVNERFDATTESLPAGWSDQDIGAVGLSGGASYYNGTYTVVAEGTDIWGSADSFNFAYMTLNGDGQIVARVTALKNTNAYAKAGVMIRGALTAGSSHALLDAKPDGGLELLSRATGGDQTSFLAGGTGGFPVWLKLVRIGGTISAYSSADGTNWTTVGTTSLAFGTAAYVGLAVTSHSSGNQTTATFDNVAATSDTGGPGPAPLPAPWADQDIGSVGLSGSTSYDSTAQRFTVNAAGADIWGTADSFNFLYQTFSSDIQVVARVTGLTNTNAYAKAGVMMRASLAPDAAHVLLDVKPGGGFEFMSRASPGASTSFLASGTGTAPVWLKLARTGSTVTAYTSADGAAWTTVGATTISLGSSPFVGLATTSHDVTKLTTATYENVSVGSVGTGTDAPPAVSITSPTSGATFTAPANITIAATATDSDATPVARVDFYSNGALLGSDTSSPYSYSWANVAAGSYSLTAVAVDTAGLQTTSGAVSITVGSSGGGGGLPAGWTDLDVGSVGLKGSATYNNGTFSVKGAGADIWGTADSFNFVYQALAADGQITARLASQQNTNQYAKAGVMIRGALTAGSPHVVLDVKAGGGYEFMTRAASGGTTSFIGGGTAAAPMWLRLARNGTTVSAFTSTDGNTWSPLGDVTLNVTGTVYVGMVVCSHDTTVLNTSTFDNASVFVGTTAPPPTSTLSFTPKVIAVNGTASGTAVGVSGFYGPTSLTVGPDGKLYVSVVNGKIFVLTIDQTKLSQAGQVAVTHVQEIDSIYLKPSLTCNINGDPNNCQQLSSVGSGRLVTGIMVGNDSTATRIVLYVSNSNMSTTSADMSVDTYSGTITRLSLERSSTTALDYSVTGNQDLVVGLPRSRDVHAVNGMSMGPDGWLYLGIGGNTNAGQPSAFFGNLPEYYLSAMVVRLNLANLSGTTLPIDVRNVRSASDLTPFTGKFEIFATGYRNPYDIAWHSNGRLYLNGNAANMTEGNTPGSSDGCSTPSITPGDQPDTLNIVTKGAYGGHPNPTHGECVWGDGTIYSPPLAPLSNYVAPIANYLAGASTDGIAEYKANAFSGAMQGNLITATYAGNQTVRRVVLNANGSGVSSIESLGTFNKPLDVWPDASGNIFIAEYGGNQITVLLPTSVASCPVPNSDPHTTDSDSDGYTDYDEQSNGTDPCSAASFPSDADHDFLSDLLDTDDDNDGIADAQDELFLDPQNGGATTLPLGIEWNPTDPAYGKVAGTGFTGIQQSSRATIDQATGHPIVRDGIHPGDAGGHLVLWTYSGTAQGTANSQVNALQIGFDSSAAFRTWMRIVQPFSAITPAAGHVGGTFFGPGEDNYARLAIVGTASGGKVVQFAIESGGTFNVIAQADLTGVTIDNLDLFLVGNPANGTVAAYYDLNISGTMTALGAATPVPVSWFGNNVTAPNRSLAGLVVSNGSAAQTAFGYDFFRIDRNVPGSPPPPPPSTASDVVIYADDLAAAAVHGTWRRVADASSPNGIKLATPNANVSPASQPLASPTDYVDVAFNADAGVPYTMWLRLKAEKDSKNNDSVWVQFSDARVNGSSVYGLNSTSGLTVNLQECQNCRVSGWGWTNSAYWLQQAATVTFATTGQHTLRIQVREDGVAFDQIVLSPSTYLTTRPGAVRNDTTIVTR